MFSFSSWKSLCNVGNFSEKKKKSEKNDGILFSKVIAESNI